MNQDNNSPMKPSAATATRRLAPRIAIDGDESAKLDTNQLLLETASRVDNAICELMEYATVLTEPGTVNKSKLKKMGDNIKGTIIPVMYIAARSLGITGTAFAPIAVTKYVFDRSEAQRKREVVDTQIIMEKSVGIQLMDDFVKRSAIDVPEEPHLAVKKPRYSLNPLETKDTIAILRPANGYQYTKTEYIQAVTMHEKSKRAVAKRAIQAKEFAPAHFQTLDRLVREFEADGTLPDPEFNEFVGKPRKGETFAPKRDEVKVTLSNTSDATAAILKPDSGSNLIQVTLDRKVVGKRKRKQKEDSSSIVNTDVETDMENEPTQKKNRGDAAASSSAATKLPPSQSTTECSLQEQTEKFPAKALPVPPPPPPQNSTNCTKTGMEVLASAAGSKLPPKEQSTTKCTPKLDEKKISDEVRSFPLPLPLNGNIYTKSEAVNVAKQYKKNTRERGLAVEAMISRGYIPLGVRTMNRLLEQDEKGIPIFDTEWKKGRPRILTDDEIGTLIRQKQAEGSSSTLPDVEAMKKLLEKKKKRLKVLASKPAAKKQPTIRRTPKKSVDAMNFPLPPPQNGNIYTKSEAVHVAKQYKKGSRERALAMEAMIRQGYVPGTSRKIQRLLAKDAEGKPIHDTDWSILGAPPQLTNDEVEAIVEQLKQGSFEGKVDIKQVVKNAILEKAARLSGGTVEETDTVQCSSSCVRSYEVVILSKLGSTSF